MHFLNTSLLWPLLPLVGIPIIIHWLSKRFPKKFVFSSIENIRQTMAGRSRVFRSRHLLMLLLRTLALAALLIAFIKPVITTHINRQGQKRNVILIVDHSLSMNYKESGTTARSKAQAEVARLLKSLDADNQFNVIRVDHSPVAAFAGFSTHRDAALEFLKKSPESLAYADFNAANQLAAQLAKDSKGDLDIYYFSDFQRRDWADVNFNTLPTGARLFFISATDNSQRGNHAIASLSLGTGAVIAGGETEVKARVANHSSAPWSGKIEAGFDIAHLREKEFSLAPWSEGNVEFIVPVPSSGLLKLSASLPNDSLPQDNHSHLVVKVSDREEVVLLTANNEESKTPAPLLFLTTAVDPYGGEQGIYQPKHLEPATLQPAALASCSRLIASRLPLLTDNQANVLVNFLRGGGGMILFLDGEADAANLRKIEEISGDKLPLQISDKLSSANLPDGAMQVATGAFNSRFLRLFDGERRQNLSLLEFYDLYHASKTGHGQVLLGYADGTPALTESGIGLGTLLICNFSVAETSSNMARQRLFPAWIHEMLLQINQSGVAEQEAFHVGDSISGETWANEAIGRELMGPSGKPARNRSQITGERIKVSFTANEPGFYTLSDAGRRDLLAFAVNTDANQSDLRTIDPSVLPDRAGQSHDNASFIGSTGDYNSLLRGKPAFHWFLLACLLFLFIEGILFKKPKQSI